MAYYYPQYQQAYQQAVPDQLQQMRNNYLPPTQMSVTNDERIWVTRAGAEAYLVAPNSFVRLWDQNEPVFYEKRADQTGRPYMEVFEYKKRGEQKPTVQPGTDYLAEINALRKRVEVLEKMKGVVANVSESATNDSAV